MIWQVEDFLREVRTAMDENAHGDALRLEEDSDTLDIDGIIRSKIEEAVRYVTSSAPVELLDGGIPAGARWAAVGCSFPMISSA